VPALATYLARRFARCQHYQGPLASRRDNPIEAQGRAQRRQPRSAALGNQAPQHQRSRRNASTEPAPRRDRNGRRVISGLFPRCKRTRCICKRTIPYFGLDGSWIDILRFNYRNQPRIDSVSADRRLMEAARLDRSSGADLTQGGAWRLRRRAGPGLR